jgi:hypothetical protein
LRTRWNRKGLLLSENAIDQYDQPVARLPNREYFDIPRLDPPLSFSLVVGRGTFESHVVAGAESRKGKRGGRRKGQIDGFLEGITRKLVSSSYGPDRRM